MAAVRSLVHCAANEGWISAGRRRADPQAGALAPGDRLARGPAHAAGRRAALPPPSRPHDPGRQARLCLLGVLFACGLRRAELCNLEVKTIGRLNEGWALIDLMGKRQKVRSIPLEAPIKQGIDEWLAAAKISSGRVFRAIRKNGKVWGNGLGRVGDLADRPPLCRPGRPRELCPPRCPPVLRPHLLRRQSPAQTDSVSLGTRQARHHRPLRQRRAEVRRGGGQQSGRHQLIVECPYTKAAVARHL